MALAHMLPTMQPNDGRRLNRQGSRYLQILNPAERHGGQVAVYIERY
jgi:hypothetical protein